MIKGWFNPQVVPETLLLKYYQTKDNGYLEQLVTQYNRAMYHYLLTLSDADLAKDVLQNTWLKVVSLANNKSQQASVPASVKNWLFTIARNLLIDELRRQQRWQWHAISEEHIVTPTLDQSIVKQDKLQQLEQALSSLPFGQKEALIFQQEGFSLFEISQLTGEGVETIKSRLRYAKNNLKILLGTQHEQ